MPGKKISAADKALIRRYLVWCYKTTKESLDRVDRKFTQALVDRYILKRIALIPPSVTSQRDYLKFIDDFKVYTATKEKDGCLQKFCDEQQTLLNPEYLYLQERFKAIEVAIRYFLGPRELAKINLLYEQEMTRRILESKEH